MVARCSVSATDRLDATRRDASGTSPQAATVGHLSNAAQVAPMAHRAPAAAHQQTETEPDRRTASGTSASRQHRNLHDEATSRVRTARHRALAALPRLTAHNTAECRRLCGTSQQEATGRGWSDGMGWVTDRLHTDLGLRALKGQLAVGLWPEDAEADAS